MKKLLLAAIFTALIASAASAAQRTVTVEWSYASGVTGLAGFRFYRDGALVSTLNDPAARTHTMVLDISTATLSLDMSAIFSDGSEGPRSLIKTVLTSTPANLRITTYP